MSNQLSQLAHEETAGWAITSAVVNFLGTQGRRLRMHHRDFRRIKGSGDAFLSVRRFLSVRGGEREFVSRCSTACSQLVALGVYRSID